MKSRWSRILFVLGAIAMVAGAADPLEGSVVILVGSALVLGSEFGRSAERRRLRFWAGVFVLIAFGVGVMMGLSAVGGIGGRKGRSLWWGLLILPYPVGWLVGIGGLVARGVRAFQRRSASRPG